MPPTTATPRAGLYSRESKDKTRSIEDQAAENREAASDNGWDVRAEYFEGTSASRFGRKARGGWEQLLADVEGGLLDVVVAWEFSRADRDMDTWVPFVSKCRARGILIHLTGDGDTLDARNPSHYHRLISGVLDAAVESEKTSKRTRRGVARAAAAGKPHGGPPPFGYLRVIVGERSTRHGLKPVKEQRKSGNAPIVVEIFQRLARSEPISAIVRELNERGVRPPKGETWSRYSIREMAANPAYLGKRRHRSQREGEEPVIAEYEGIWPPLVDAVLFHRVQDVLGRPDRQKTKPGGLRWLLSYLAATPCGGVVHTAPERAGRAARYVCHGCGCVSIAVAAADEVMARLVCARLSRSDVRSLFTPDDSAARAAENELAELEAELKQWRALAKARKVSPASFAEFEMDLLPRIADAKRRSRAGTTSGAMADLLDAAQFGTARVRPVWDGLPVAARREVLTMLATPVLGRADRALSRWATEDERLAVATLQFGPSRWTRDDLTWAQHWAAEELAA